VEFIKAGTCGSTCWRDESLVTTGAFWNMPGQVAEMDLISTCLANEQYACGDNPHVNNLRGL